MNLDAQSDLFEYYLEAPGFLGGGLDKADATAVQIGTHQPGRWVNGREAKLAEKRKESSSAEAHLRRAIELAPQQVGRLIESGALPDQTGPVPGGRSEFGEAEKIAPDSPRLMFAQG